MTISLPSSCTRRFAAGCTAPLTPVVLTALALMVVLTGCQDKTRNAANDPAGEEPPTQPVATVTTVEFTEEQLLGDAPGEGPPSTQTSRTVIAMGLDRTGKVVSLYTAVRGANRKPVTETIWSAAKPKVLTLRDWTSCEEDKADAPGKLDTVEDILDDLIGPRTPPPAAKIIKPNPKTWELGRGTFKIRVFQTGPAYTDRTVETLGDGEKVSSRVHGVRLGTATAVPAALPGWDDCKPSFSGGTELS